MAGRQEHTREELQTAVAASRSWRGVLRALGRPGTSAGSRRAVRRQVEHYGIDCTHFTGQRRWTDQRLIDAIREASSWQDVLTRLGLFNNGGNLATVRAHAVRLAVDTAHLGRRQQSRSPALPPRTRPRIDCLRVAGPALAAAWFLLRGFEVSWPLEPCRYDLVVHTGDHYERVQVKTATYFNAGTYLARISNARRIGRDIYQPEEIDCFFIIDAELNAYLVPIQEVAGYTTISLRSYRAYLVAERGQWLTAPSDDAAAS